MISFLQGDFERAICNLLDYFNIKGDGLTNGECIDILRTKCPKLHSEDFLIEMDKRLLSNIQEEFGYTGLRVWFKLCTTNPFFSRDDIMMKYNKLYSDIQDYVKDFLKENDVTLLLDVMVATIHLKKLYKTVVGQFNEDDLMDLWGILNTLRLSYYNQQVIDNLYDLIYSEVASFNHKYYLSKDLHNKDVLKEMFVEVGEIIGDGNCFEGHSMFKNYDGYGNAVYHLY